jgi:hypothetical protein
VKAADGTVVRLYLFDYYVPWWALLIVGVLTVAGLCLGLLYWYYRPTFEWP